jgi:pantoate kinase
MGSPELRRARAFAPGHITGVFRPERSGPDPRARGSVGIGLVLELGVRATATYDPTGPRRVRVTGDVPGPLSITRETARRLLGPRTGRLTVHVVHELPVGHGFGTSAAGATAAGLAVVAVLDEPRQRALEVAHLADLFGGGGLGGVAAILGGGLEVRYRPGIPPFGKIVHFPFPEPVLVGVVGGPLPSPEVLANHRTLRRIRLAASEWTPTGQRIAPEEFFALSERFTDAIDLAPPGLRAVLRGLRRRGARAFQAMFGRTFAALPRDRSSRRRVVEWLELSGIHAIELRAATRGAHREPFG